MRKERDRGINHLVDAFGWSMAGLRSALKKEAAFRQELALFVILAPLGFWLGKTGEDKALLVGSLFLILIVELLNTSIEAVVDRIGKESHKLSGRAKDLGSAAVFLTLFNAAFVWFFVLFY